VPLRAQIDGNDINAFDYDSAAWTVLKATYKTSNLQMPCCQNSAIPKTSKLGNLFFAHARRGECAFAAESAEHIYLKTLVAKAAQACGWLVVTEAQGNAPDGTKWVADVLCAQRVKVSWPWRSSFRIRQSLRWPHDRSLTERLVFGLLGLQDTSGTRPTTSPLRENFRFFTFCLSEPRRNRKWLDLVCHFPHVSSRCFQRGLPGKRPREFHICMA
jgi:hypothetical protein